jgi:hypothetical protein
MAVSDAEFDAIMARMDAEIAANKPRKSYLDAVSQTWPAQAVKSLLGAVTVFGDVAEGKHVRQPEVPHQWSDVDEAAQQANDRNIFGRTVDLAGSVMGGAYVSPAVSGSVGMGIRSLPADNYLTPLSKYTSRLWRETSPEEALNVLPHSAASVGGGPAGAQRQFYADTPDLALGQGANRGARVEYDAGAFEGQINKKPGWEPLFEQGAAEYKASPLRDANIREAVRSISINKAALNEAPRHVRARYDTLISKLKASGWDGSESKEYFDLVRKYGLADGAVIGAAASSPDFGAQLEQDLQAAMAQ